MNAPELMKNMNQEIHDIQHIQAEQIKSIILKLQNNRSNEHIMRAVREKERNLYRGETR